jgi:hypothetical protein
MPSLPPELLKVLHTFLLDPTASKVHQQIAVAIAHVVSALCVRIEFSLRIYADVIADEAVFEWSVPMSMV